MVKNSIVYNVIFIPTTTTTYDLAKCNSSKCPKQSIYSLLLINYNVSFKHLVIDILKYFVYSLSI